jgi:peptidoglycan hydrolase CwlO-like protein
MGDEIKKALATLTELDRKAEETDNAVDELFHNVSETQKRREEVDAKAARVERRLAEAS